MRNTTFSCGVSRLHLFYQHRLEVPPRFELGSGAFAELCLTTWLWHHFIQGMHFRRKILPREKTGQTRFAPFGASDEARTRYLHLGKVALYQMSYTRIQVPAGNPCGDGASGRNRTNDTRIFSPLLYQLSYRGKSLSDGGTGAPFG